MIKEYSPKLVKMFKSEQEASIIDILVGMMDKIIEVGNCELILSSLFDKFKQHQNMVAINAILEIQPKFRAILKVQDGEVCMKFDKFVLLYIWIPLLDLYSNQPKKLSKKH